MSRITFDFSSLRGEIIKKYGTIDRFADAVGKYPAQVSNKLNGKSDLRQSDIKEWSDALSISAEQIPTFFFCVKV